MLSSALSPQYRSAPPTLTFPANIGTLLGDSNAHLTLQWDTLAEMDQEGATGVHFEINIEDIHSAGTWANIRSLSGSVFQSIGIRWGSWEPSAGSGNGEFTYFNGSSFVLVPAAGMPIASLGNSVRFAVRYRPAVANADGSFTYEWRVRCHQFVS